MPAEKDGLSQPFDQAGGQLDPPVQSCGGPRDEEQRQGFLRRHDEGRLLPAGERVQEPVPPHTGQEAGTGREFGRYQEGPAGKGLSHDPGGDIGHVLAGNARAMQATKEAALD